MADVAPLRGVFHENVIEQYQFKDKQIETAKIRENVIRISKGAFSGCTRLSKVEWPPKLREIQTLAFQGCSALTGTLILPNTVTSIAADAFKGTGYTRVEIPPLMTTFTLNAFNNQIEYYILPKGIKELKNQVNFYDEYKNIHLFAPAKEIKTSETWLNDFYGVKFYDVANNVADAQRFLKPFERCYRMINYYAASNDNREIIGQIAHPPEIPNTPQSQPVYSMKRGTVHVQTLGGDKFEVKYDMNLPLKLEYSNNMQTSFFPAEPDFRTLFADQNKEKLNQLQITDYNFSANFDGFEQFDNKHTYSAFEILEILTTKMALNPDATSDDADIFLNLLESKSNEPPAKKSRTSASAAFIDLCVG